MKQAGEDCGRCYYTRNGRGYAQVFIGSVTGAVPIGVGHPKRWDAQDPGEDVIRGDADGCVMVRREDAADVARKSAEREEAEAGYIAAYKSGRTIIDVCNLEAALKAKGLTTDL